MCNLKILRLQWCPMLTSSLFVPAMARRLVLLEELKIFDCSKLKHIIAEEYEADENASNPSPTLRGSPIHTAVSHCAVAYNVGLVYWKASTALWAVDGVSLQDTKKNY